MRTISADVAIVGGGIVGVSSALWLARRGKRVVVFERGMIGAEASGRNGGGVRQQGRVLPEIEIARGAAALWSDLDELLGRPTGYRRVGNMFIAKTDAEMDSLAEQRRQELALGLESELIDAAQVRALAPGLADGYIGGKLCPTDGHAVPAQATVAIAEAAQEAGAELLSYTPATRIGVASGRVEFVEGGEVRVEAPIVINAAGPWAGTIAQMVESYLPIFPSRGHASCTAPVPHLAEPFVIAASWDFSACQDADGRVQLGGGADRGDLSRFTYNKRPDSGYLERIRRRAGEVFPALRDVAIEFVWAGTRECTPDMMPIIGPTDGPEGFLVCAGFSGHGFCLGPYAGQLMSEWIVDGAPSLDVSAFSYRRFLRPEGPLAVLQMALEQTG
jgi:sarcosine oxidase subunit beta